MANEVNLGINIDTDQAQKNVEGLTASLGSLGASFVRMAGIIVGFTALKTIANQFTNAINQAVKFEKQIAEIQKVTSADVAQDLSEEIRVLSSRMPVARDNLAEITEEAGRLGVQGTKNITEFTETVAKLEVATNLASKEAAKNFARILTVTNTVVGNIGNLGSSVNELSNNMATSADEIVNGMQRVAATASQFGLTADQIAAVSASINEVSATARRANTRLRRLFQELQSPNKVREVAGALDITSQKFRQLREDAPRDLLFDIISSFKEGSTAADQLKQALGSASRQAVAGLSQNLEGLRKALDLSREQFRKNTSLQREYEIQSDTTAAKLQVLSNNFTNLATSFGSTLKPAFDSFIDTLNTIIGGLESVNKVVADINETSVNIKNKFIKENVEKNLRNRFSSLRQTIANNFEKFNGLTEVAVGDISKTITQQFNRLPNEVNKLKIANFLDFRLKQLEKRGAKNFQDALRFVRSGLRQELEDQNLSQETINEIIFGDTNKFKSESKNAGEESGKSFFSGFTNTLSQAKLFKKFKEITPSDVDDIFADKFGESTLKEMKPQIKELRKVAGEDLDFGNFQDLNKNTKQTIKSLIKLKDEINKVGNNDEEDSIFNTSFFRTKSEQIRAKINKIKNNLNNLPEDITTKQARRKLENLRKKLKEVGEESTNVFEDIQGISASNFLTEEEQLQRRINKFNKVRDIIVKNSKITAEQFDKQINKMENRLDNMNLSDFEKNIRKASQGAKRAFENNFVKAMRGGFDDIEDALKGFARSFIQQLQQIVASRAAQQLFGSGQTEDSGFDSGFIGNLFSGFNLGSFFSFGDTPGPISGDVASRSTFASNDKVVASKTTQGLRNQVGTEEQSETTVNQEINFPTVSDQKIDRRIQKAAPRIAELAAQKIRNDNERGGQPAQNVRTA